MRLTVFSVFCIFFGFSSQVGYAKLELGAPFGDNAILQRGMDHPVWGWSDPGTKVVVEFAGQKREAVAGEDGKWTVELSPLEASFEPGAMKISEVGGESQVLENLLVGEVWMASGQSNMQWPVGKTSAAGLSVEAKNGVVPIRECRVTDYFATVQPIERATGVWTNGDYEAQSAIAFAFAHKLYGELGVPIGILNCSFSQTSIEAWTPREGFAAGEDAYTKEVYGKVLEADPTTAEHEKAWGEFYESLEASLEGGGEGVAELIKQKPGNLSGNRDATWLFNARLNPMIPFPVRGAIWNQGYANMNAGFQYYYNLHSLIRGWREVWGRPDLPVYFHQFYSAGREKDSGEAYPEIGGAADMRVGTWLARDLPNADMASQIDIEGAIHYRHKTVPGQRLALHALKNEYGKDLVVSGPMFKGYAVEGEKLIVEFENVESGLVVAETGSNATGKEEDGATGFADPKVIEDGADQVELFYLAGEDRVWHPADLKIEGEKVILTAEGVESPRGVSYGSGGVGFRPNLYNKELLPMTPFTFYDHEMVTAETWPDEVVKIAGVEVDPSEGGLLYEYRKMPLLSSQFRDNAVFQADQPVTIWGSAVHDWGYEAEGKAEIKFRFGEIEETILVQPGMKEWRVTLPARPASAERQVLKVRFEIEGEVVHERIAENIVFGDVIYVGAPDLSWELPEIEKSEGVVRMMTRKAKRSSAARASRFSVAVSTTPENRFASVWEEAEGAAAVIGHRIGRETGRPVGVVFMQSVAQKNGPDAELKEWISAECLEHAPSLEDDYQQLASIRPGNEFYAANVGRYIEDWEKMWGEYVPKMMATKGVPDQVPWGSYPQLEGLIETEAAQTHNVLVESFTPASLRGVIFLSGPMMVAGDQGEKFGEQLSVLGNCLRGGFGGEDLPFIYTIPDRKLAPKVTVPTGITGIGKAVGVSAWEDGGVLIEITDKLLESLEE